MAVLFSTVRSFQHPHFDRIALYIMALKNCKVKGNLTFFLFFRISFIFKKQHILCIFYTNKRNPFVIKKHKITKGFLFNLKHVSMAIPCNSRHCFSFAAKQIFSFGKIAASILPVLFAVFFRFIYHFLRQKNILPKNLFCHIHRGFCITHIKICLYHFCIIGGKYRTAHHNLTAKPCLF